MYRNNRAIFSSGKRFKINGFILKVLKRSDNVFVVHQVISNK